MMRRLLPHPWLSLTILLAWMMLVNRFAADRWDVLYAPPKGQTAADVWRSMVVQGLGATLKAAALAAPLALVLGLVLALWRTARVPWVRLPAVVVPDDWTDGKTARTSSARSTGSLWRVILLVVTRLMSRRSSTSRVSRASCSLMSSLVVSSQWVTPSWRASQ